MADLPKFVTHDGNVVVPKDAGELKQFRDVGYAQASPADIKIDNLRQQYSAWYFAPAAAALGVAQSIPGLQSATLGVMQAISPDAAQNTAEYMQGVAAAHPIANMAGNLGGLVGGGMGGLGAASKAFGMTGAAALAAQGAAQGAGYTADKLALEHVYTQEGGEKALGELGIGAAIGAVSNLAVGKLLQSGGAVKAAGGKLRENLSGLPGLTNEEATFLNEHNMLFKSPKQIGQFIRNTTKQTQKVFDEAHYILSETGDREAQAGLAQQLRDSMEQFGLRDKELASKIGQLQTKGMNLAELHGVRMHLDSNINYGDISQAGQAMIGMRDAVKGHMNDIALSAMESGEPAIAEQGRRFLDANQTFSTAMQIQARLKDASAHGRSWFATMGDKSLHLGTSAAVEAAGLGMGAPLGATTLAAAAVSGAGQKVGRLGLEGLSRAMLGFDKATAGAVALGLDGSVPRLATEAGIGVSHYDSLATAVSSAGYDPAGNTIAAAQEMERQGVAGPIIDAVIPHQMRAAQYLAAQVPQNPLAGQSVAPVAVKPTLRQKADFIDKVNAVNNPLEAIRNPNPARIEALQAVYPSLLQQVRSSIAQEAATRPDLSPRARRWASMLTGIPASPLGNPGARAAMLKAEMQEAMKRQQEAQQAQKQQGGRPGRPGGTSNPDMTQAQRLSE